jgi:phosphonate transport system ATP-binding protein
MQRVGICRAMMQNPKLLLADEPISSLDPASAKIVLDQIKTLTESRGLTSIINLHQVDFAKAYAGRIVGLRLGQIVFDGKPDALTDDMADYIYAQ